jgi:arylsulfatase A-like enzyme
LKIRALLLVSLLPLFLAAADNPNVILILADDLGWGDVSCNNPESKIQTPNVDKLAAQGIRFTDGHASSSQCSPTRYGLLTGRYSWRTRLQHGVLRHFDTPLIDREQFTLAELFKQQGYATACIGKWHLGLGWQAKQGQTFKPDSWDAKQIDAIDFTKKLTDSPVDHGFDYFWGQNASNNMLPYCYVENNRVVQIPTERKKPVFETEHGHGLRSSDYFSANIDQKNWEQIDKWLKQQTDDKPFFLYYPMSAIHLPCLPTKKFIGSSEGGLRGDKTVEMDNIVGRIMKWLDETGKADNTIVIFTSDNGHARYGDSIRNLRMLAGNNFGKAYNPDKLLTQKPEKGDTVTYGHKPGGPYRGKKLEVYEGGHRVPFIVRWPARIETGSVSDQLVSTLDFMQTFATILGVELPEGAAPDSSDMSTIWFGVANSHCRASLISKGWQPNALAIRNGDWKLVTYKGEFLYNLRDDPGEKHNLASQHPEKVATLKTLLAKIRQ